MNWKSNQNVQTARNLLFQNHILFFFKIAFLPLPAHCAQCSQAVHVQDIKEAHMMCTDPLKFFHIIVWQ